MWSNNIKFGLSFYAACLLISGILIGIATVATMQGCG